MQSPSPQSPADVTPPDPPAPDPPEAGEAVDLILGKLDSWVQASIELLPNLMVALLLVAVAMLLGRFARRITVATLRRTPLQPPIRSLVATSVWIVVVTGGVFIALGVLGLDKTVTSLLAGVGILGLVIGLAFQDMATNLMAGVTLSVRRPINVGEIAEIGGYFGTVEEINLRATVMRQPTGELVFLPNRQVLENPLINFSRRGERRVDLEVGVSYGDDLEKAKRVAVEAVEGLSGRKADRPVELFFEGFGASSVNFVVRFWVTFRRQPDYLGPRGEAVQAIHRAFAEHDITIPFPIRTLDFGIVGGEDLRSQLPAAGLPGRRGDGD